MDASTRNAMDVAGTSLARPEKLKAGSNVIVFRPRPGQARFVATNACKVCGLGIPANQKCNSRFCRRTRTPLRATSAVERNQTPVVSSDGRGDL